MMKYAELIVMLQKEFNFTFLITTHSPYFAKAIQVYSKKHNINKKCNYYLAEYYEGISEINKIENLNIIFDRLLSPMERLCRLEECE